jgi:hypothetical protein
MTEPCIQSLPEPDEMRYADAEERITMLLSHLDYGPSAEWIRDVLTAAERELRSPK